jgi:hypothetical protein
MLKRHECRISRRGKGAKGVVTVSTFGIPVKAKKAEKGDPVKKWDYSFAAKLSTSDIIDAVRKIGNINEILLIGADYFLKSSGVQAQSKSNLLAIDVFNAGLALDIDEAKSVAMAFIQAQANMAKLGLPEPSIEQLMDARRLMVEKLKRDGLWKKEKPQPKLVKKTEESEPEESDDDESDDDSDDDTEEEIEA